MCQLSNTNNMTTLNMTNAIDGKVNGFPSHLSPDVLNTIPPSLTLFMERAYSDSGACVGIHFAYDGGLLALHAFEDCFNAIDGMSHAARITKDEYFELMNLILDLKHGYVFNKELMVRCVDSEISCSLDTWIRIHTEGRPAISTAKDGIPNIDLTLSAAAISECNDVAEELCRSSTWCRKAGNLTDNPFAGILCCVEEASVELNEAVHDLDLESFSLGSGADDYFAESEDSDMDDFFAGMDAPEAIADPTFLDLTEMGDFNSLESDYIASDVSSFGGGDSVASDGDGDAYVEMEFGGPEVVHVNGPVINTFDGLHDEIPTVPVVTGIVSMSPWGTMHTEIPARPRPEECGFGGCPNTRGRYCDKCDPTSMTFTRAFESFSGME